MKKTLVLLLGAVILGSFSIAEANVIASQPVASTPVAAQGGGHNIASWCLPVSSAYQMASVSFVVTSGAKQQAYALYFSEATNSDCSSRTLIGSAGTATVSSSSVNVVDVTAQNWQLSGVSYMLLELSDNGTAGTMTNPTLGTTGQTTGAIFDNNAFILVLDQYGNTTVPDWADIVISPAIDWSDLAIIATSSSLFGDSSSTLENISNQCADSGNIFTKALCRAFTFLWIPNPTVLNQYTEIGPQLATKFPLSWFYQIQTEINTVSTTTLSSPTWTMNFHDIGIGSSTPMGNILPNLIVFSSSTVKHYISESNWNALMTLAAAAIWLGAFYTLYAVGHNLFTGRIKSL